MVFSMFILRRIPIKNGSSETLTTDAASDGLMVDLDGDGVEELCTFTPFHGNEVRIYRKENGKYELVYTYPEKLPFLHALWGGELCGKNTWVLGYRNGDRQLLAITYEDGEYKAKIRSWPGAANLLTMSMTIKTSLLPLIAKAVKLPDTN